MCLKKLIKSYFNYWHAYRAFIDAQIDVINKEIRVAMHNYRFMTSDIAKNLEKCVKKSERIHIVFILIDNYRP